MKRPARRRSTVSMPGPVTVFVNLVTVEGNRGRVSGAGPRPPAGHAGPGPGGAPRPSGGRGRIQAGHRDGLLLVRRDDSESLSCHWPWHVHRGRGGRAAGGGGGGWRGPGRALLSDRIVGLRAGSGSVAGYCDCR
jgi:hypothetical protein